MTKRAQLADGRILEFPDETPDSVMDEVVLRAVRNPQSTKTTQELEAAPAAPSTLRDVAEAGVSGLAGGIKGLSDIFGVNNVVSKKMEELQRESYGRLTPERQREMQIEDELSRRAAEEGAFAEFKQAGRSFLRSPLQTGIGALASSAPMIAATAVAPEATIPAMLAGRAGLGAAAARTAIANAPAIGVGAAMGVGSQKGQDYERVKQAMLDAGRSEEEAEDAAQKAAEYSLQNAARQAAAGVAGGAEGAFGVESLLGRAGRARPGVKAGPEAPTWKGAIAQSTLGEALPEAVQSGVGAVGSNIALQQAGIDTDLFKGVTGEVTTGALAGALMGTAVSPLQMRQLRQEYGRDVLEKKLEEIRKQQEQVAKTKEELGTPTALALPAPAPKVEEQDPLQNPLGNLTKDELGPEVTGYIEQYRSKNGMPLLNSYSIEDVRDAMTQVNPAGEAAALDSLVAAKSGYQPDVTYSAQDVLNAATDKVDTTTQGFRDFLRRTTGNENLETMSQPQLYAAFKALENVPTGQGLTILPEGSNASRFTEAQMDKGLDKVRAAIQANKEKPAVTPEQAIGIVKKATKLKQDRDAATLLKQLVRENHLDVDADGNFIAPTKIENLPAGYTLEKGTFKQSDQQLYGVLSDGKPLEGVDTYTNPEDAQAKVDALNKTREKQAEIIAQQIKKAQDQIDRSQQELDAMEAAGEGGTAEYKKAKAKHDAMTSKIGDDYSDLYARYEMFKTPLTMGPMGMKQVNRTGYTLFKDGVPVSTHPTTDAALDSLVGTMPEEEVTAMAQNKTPGMRDLARKARQRLEGKERIAEKEAEEAAIPEEEKTARAEEKEKAEQMFKQLGAILKKFGLGDLQLQIIKGMEDEGSYTARLIRIAMDIDDPVGVLRHESIHALKDLGFFTDAQWKALVRMANDKWVDQHLRKVAGPDGRSRFDAYQEMFQDEASRKGLTGKDADNYVQNALIEEAIADAFRAFGKKPPPGMLTAILNKIKQFFQRLKGALNAAGYESAEDIFGKIEAGQLKPSKEAGTEEKLSKRPSSDIGHKREASTGRYVGSPDWVGGSPQQLTNLRKKLARLAKEGEGGRYWYENSSRAILDMVGGDKKEAEKIVGLIAIYSPNATVPANTSMALNAYYQYKTGQPINAGLTENDKKAEELLRQGKEWSGIKTNSFYQNLMVEIDPSKLDPGVATMDMWMALAFDYGMKALDQGPKYKFAEREIQRLADQLGWDAHQVQAAIWTAMKGRIDPIRNKLKAEELKNGIGETYMKDGKELFRVKPDRRYDHFRLAHQMGMDYDLRPEDIDASMYDFSNAINDRSAQMSWEATPGGSTGVLPGLLEAPIDQKFEYLEAISDTLKNDKGQDKIAERIGLPSGKTIFGFSAWQGDIGAGAQTFVTVAMRGAKDKRDLTPESKNLLNLYSAIKGYVLAQEAVVWHVPSYDGSIKNQNGIQATFNRGLTEKEMKTLYEGLHEKFGTWEIAPGYIPNGFRALNFTSIPNKEFHKGVEQVLSKLPSDFGGGMMDFVAYRSIGDYIGNDWTSAKNGEDYEATIESLASQVGIENGSDLLNWAANLRSDVEAVNKKFSEKYDWGKPGVGEAVEPGVKKLSLRAPNTKEFKQWFGRSKVVNEDGEPIVVYHASPNFEGYEFKKTKKVNRTGNPDGYYFSSSPSDAADYARDLGYIADRIQNPEKYDRNSPILYAEGAEIIPVYLSIENPYDYKAKTKPNREMIRQFEKELREDNPNLGDDWINEKLDIFKEGRWPSISFPTDAMTRVIKAGGYDGMKDGRHWIAFDSNQIKSAIGNIGTYSAKSPDIRKSLRAPDTKEFNDWFDESKVVNKEGEPMVMYHGTARDISEFKPKTANAIFVSPDPDVGSIYSADSFDWLSKNAKDELTEEQQAKAKADALAAVEEDFSYLRDPAERKQPDYKKLVAKRDAILKDIEKNAFGKKRLSEEALPYLATATKDYLPTGPNIMPLFVRALRPFDYENKKHLDMVIDYLAHNYTFPGEVSERVKEEAKKMGMPTEFSGNKLAALKSHLARGLYQKIESEPVQRAIRALKFDSFYVKEHGVKNLGVYSPVQLKSATGNIGSYSPTDPDIRKSLRPNVPEDLQRLINEKVAVRDEKTWLQRLMSAIVPTESDAFRQAVFNRYQRIGTREKLAAKKDNIEQYTADMSAEFAALQSDRAAELMASAMGIHDGKGGIPVYRNGFTMIWNDNGKITGPLDIFQPLAKLNDPKVFQHWQFWKSAQRGVRLDEVSGKPTQFGKDELAQAKRLEALYPEGLFKQVDQAWDRYNRGLVDYMVQTGVISRAMGNEWVKHGDYFPFYRQQMDEDAKGPKMFSAISGVKAPKELKGGEDTVGDFFENIIRNTQSAIEAGMKNIAAQRAIDNELKIEGVKEVVGFKGEPKRPTSMTNVVTVLKNGETHYYECVDKLFVEAMKGLNMAEIPGLWLLSAPANLLRSFVTKTPDFIVANLLRDSMSAWVTSGANITPVIDTVKGFGAALANTDPDLKVLYDAGLIGGHEFSGKAKDTGKSLAKEMRKRAGVKTTKEKILTPVTAVWEALEKGSTASDAATRLAVYKDTMAQTGNQAEAIRRAMEIMNFQRKGNSALIRIIAAAVPFLNARLQGIDVLYRAGIKPFVDRKNASEYEKAVANAFIKRGMLMMALSVMYYMMVRDDEDYLAQEEETRDGNWIIPGLGVKIPIPFEVGIIFKTIPERTTALLMGNDTGAQFMDSMSRNIQQTFGIQLPQAVLPIIEVATGYSFFTHRPITPAGMEDVAKEYQVAPSTSRLAEVLGQFTSMTTATGKSIGLSPIELDHLLKGYTGTLGTYFADVADVVIDANSDIKSPSKRFEQMPFIRRFALDPEARGNVTAYYELKNAVDQVVRTSNLLERTGKVEDFAEYQMNNMPLLASKDYVNELYKSMKEFNQMKQQIRSSTMDPDDKRDILLAIGQAEAALVSQIKDYRKMIAE